MHRAVRNTVLLAVVPFILGIGLPETGIVTPEIGGALVALAIMLTLTVLITPHEHTTRLWLLARLPIAFRFPVYRKVRQQKPTRAPGELGALDYEMRMLAASEELSRLLNRVAKLIASTGNVAQKFTPRMEKASNASTAERVKISRDYAREAEPFVVELETIGPRYTAVAAEMSENGLKRVRAFPQQTDLTELRGTYVDLRKTITEGQGSMTGLRDALQNVRRISIQQAVNENADRQIAVVDDLIRDTGVISAFCTQAIQEIDQRNQASGNSRAARRARRNQAPA
jgi:hypothetical protein